MSWGLFRTYLAQSLTRRTWSLQAIQDMPELWESYSLFRTRERLEISRSSFTRPCLRTSFNMIASGEDDFEYKTPTQVRRVPPSSNLHAASFLGHKQKWPKLFGLLRSIMAPSAAPEALPLLVSSQISSKSTIKASVLHGPTDLRLVMLTHFVSPKNLIQWISKLIKYIGNKKYWRPILWRASDSDQVYWHMRIRC